MIFLPKLGRSYSKLHHLIFQMFLHAVENILDLKNIQMICMVMFVALTTFSYAQQDASNPNPFKAHTVGNQKPTILHVELQKVTKTQLIFLDIHQNEILSHRSIKEFLFCLQVNVNVVGDSNLSHTRAILYTEMFARNPALKVIDVQEVALRQEMEDHRFVALLKTMLLLVEQVFLIIMLRIEMSIMLSKLTI